tara:strand:- start:414 stop:1679 length:1266 start_codon:yes stop_codon:yes gene_type:complete
MVGSKGRKSKKDKLKELTTYTVPFSLGESKENNTIITNISSEFSREEIINIAINFHLQGNISEASKYYKNFIKQGFNDPRVFCNYGGILLARKKLQEAELYTRKAIKLNPDCPDSHYNLGIILKNLGKLEEAELMTRKAIKINPNDENSHYYLGTILRDLGKLKEAKLSIKKAIELKPNFTKAHRDLSICLYLSGQHLSAINSIVKAVKLNPKDIYNRLLLSIFQKDKDSKDIDLNKKNNIILEKRLASNPLLLNIPVESDLIDSLYKIKSRNQEKHQAPTYGNAKGSDYNLFEKDDPIIKNIQEKIIAILRESMNSEVLISESFFTIFRSGGGLRSHNHLSTIDKIQGLNISSKKYSLVYYLSVGDQKCDEPGILKLENPNQDIIPTDGLIIIFPAARKHSVLYKGKKDRIIIGVNFYSI